jgi:inner membrane transporter RhtA
VAATPASPSRARVPPTVLVLVSISSVQFGSAAGKTLFDEIGPGGAVFIRVALGTLVLLAMWRPHLRGHSREDLLLVLAFGPTLGAMNLAFYAALDRIPLGVTVTFEFIGPLAVAVLGSRTPRDLLWVALAAAGIVLLSDFGAADLDPLGVAFALTAAALWATYILLTVRIGRAYPGGSGLALAMVVATVALTPLGVAEGGGELLRADVIAIGAVVGLLSTVIPYSLELEALRSLPAGTFGVLMSLEPAVAALAGFVVLNEDLVPREIVAILLVVVASAGAARNAELIARDA